MKNIILERFQDFIWQSDKAYLPPWKRKLFHILQVIYVLIRDLGEGQLTLRAMSLVYTTLLSIVPFIALSFSVLKGFGVHNQVEPMLLNLLAPLGDKGVEITKRIIEFVENIKVGVLGTLGLLFLLYTVIALLQKIERSFNYIWHVSESRAIAQRFSDYLSVILVGPILVFTAMGITASISNAAVVQTISSIQPFGEIIRFVTRLLPYLLIIVAFAFIYVFIPNTKVKIRAAFIGALFSGVLWESTGWVFASFVVGSAKYTAIYSAFATLFFFMLWIYLGWLILLVGSSIAFYIQNPAYITPRRINLQVSNRFKEMLVFKIMIEIGRAFYRGGKELSRDDIVSLLNVPTIIVEQILEMLVRHKLLNHDCEDPYRYFPGKPLEELKLEEILEIVREYSNEDDGVNAGKTVFGHELESLFKEIDHSISRQLGQRTLKDIITQKNM